MISFRFSFQDTNVVMPNPNIFFLIAASVADVAAFNPEGTKTLLANGLSIFSIKGKPVLSNDPLSLHRNPNCTILDRQVLY